MANKEYLSDKETKKFLKTEIHRMKVELKRKDNTIVNLTCKIKELENKLNKPKNSNTPKPKNKREDAIARAKEVRDKLAQSRKPQEGK